LTTSATREGSTNAQAIHEQRGELEIEFGIEAENDADHEPQRQGDEESGPVHAARFSGVGRG
jgi:hypothetical protein